MAAKATGAMDSPKGIAAKHHISFFQWNARNLLNEGDIGTCQYASFRSILAIKASLGIIALICFIEGNLKVLVTMKSFSLDRSTISLLEPSGLGTVNSLAVLYGF